MPDDAPPSTLRRLDSDAIELLYEHDRYDGPISGIVRHRQEHLWFEWLSELYGGPRWYACSAFTTPTPERFACWLEQETALSAERRLVANPHVYPVPPWQKPGLRSLEEIQLDLDLLGAELETWRMDGPPIACFQEPATGFACWQTMQLSAEESQRLETWQRALAAALHDDDQERIDRLFADPFSFADPLDLHFVRRADGSVVLRDWQGRPLAPGDHISGHHRPQDYSHLRGG